MSGNDAQCCNPCGVDEPDSIGEGIGGGWDLEFGLEAGSFSDGDEGFDATAIIGVEGLSPCTDTHERESRFDGSPNAGLPELLVCGGFFVPIVDGHLNQYLGTVEAVVCGDIGEDTFETDEGADFKSVYSWCCEGFGR